MAGGVKNSKQPQQERVLYLYGVSARAGGSQPAIAVPGIDAESPVEAIDCGGLDCWISRVDRREYADRLSENIENLDWIAGAGVRHQRVVGMLARMADIVPARFGTVFLSEESLAADVKARRVE